MVRPRYYPIARSRVAAREGEVSRQDHALVRPPHGAPMIRPPIRQRSSTVGTLDSETLASAARYAHLEQVEDGAIMEIGIDEDLFAGLACKVSVAAGHVTATFRVGGDANLRRLLEAEKGRLHAALEERGMRRVTVVIEA